MKNCYRNYRRKGNTVFFLALGGIFIALGVLSFFFADGVVLQAVCIAIGAALAVFPMFVIHATYRVQGEFLCVRVFFPKKIPLSSVGAIVINIYDDYRRWKGFTREYFQGSSGASYAVPSVTFLKECDGAELDLCDTRTYTRITYRKQFLFDAALDFDFLKALKEAGYAGKVYVSELIFSQYGEAIESIFGKNAPNVMVYDRIPEKAKGILGKR